LAVPREVKNLSKNKTKKQTKKMRRVRGGVRREHDPVTGKNRPFSREKGANEKKQDSEKRRKSEGGISFLGE